MSTSAITAVVLGLLFPGIGQGLAGLRLRGIAWAIGGAATTLAILVSVWALPLTLVVRLACAFDAYRSVRRHPTTEQLASAGIALVIGALGIGGAQWTLDAFKIPSSSMYPTLVIGDHVYIDRLSVRWREPERGEIIVFDQPCAHRAYIKRVIAIAGDTVEVRCNIVYVNGTPTPATLVDANATYEDHDGVDDTWFKREAARYRETLGGHSYDTYRHREPTDRGDFPQLDRLLAPSCTQSDDFFRDGAHAASTQPRGEIVVTKQGASACEPQAQFKVPAASVFVMGDNRHNANDSRYWGVVPRGNVIGRAIGIYLSDGPAGGWDRFGAVH